MTESSTPEVPAVPLAPCQGPCGGFYDVFAPGPVCEDCMAVQAPA
jgi:hypothetical protein